MEERENEFIEHCGITFTYDGPYPIGHMTVEKHHTNPLGYIHGGMLYTLADTVSGIMLYNLGKHSVTVDSTIHYFKNVKEGHVYAVPELVSEGNKINVIRVTIYADGEKKLAEAVFTYYRVQA